MWKQFTIQGNTQYLDILPEKLKQYNDTKNSSIKITPVEARKKKNEGTVYFNLYGDMELSFVRIFKYKRKTFNKGYIPNWTEEVFTEDKIQNTDPITNKIKDLKSEKIKRSFYTEELLRAKQDVFRINKVIRRLQKGNKLL